MAAPIDKLPPIDMPPWLTLGLSILVVGAVAEAIGTVSKSGAYMFVLLVLLGYTATGGRVQNALNSLQALGVIGSNKSNG